jgi:DNA-binding NtrC family response regulator
MSATPIFHLLVVDDDKLVIDSIKLILPSHWRMISTQSTLHLSQKMNFHAAFVDMHLTKSSNPEGPKVIAQLAQENPRTEIIGMSGDLSMELMEKCLDNGARKFLPKPLGVDEVLSTLSKIEALWQMRILESKGLGHSIQLIGKSAAMEKIRQQLAELRGEGGPILIEGETGTGKEVIAQLLNSQELNRPFIPVNVAGLSENLFESEMFGHVKGAFTGADSMKIGLAEAANGGDLFLDETEALPLNHQVKLLRFLETGEIRKVGAKEASIIKARVIIGTNQNLEKLVHEGKFREDLLFRINGKKILLPPLRDRLSDIEFLAPFFMGLMKPRVNKMLSPEAIQTMMTYSWPGNVRELKRICEQLSLSSPLPIVRSEDVQILLNSIRNIKSPSNPIHLDFKMGLVKLVENFEATVFREILKTNKDVDRLAEILQISRSTFYKKMKDYNIEEKS